MNMAPDPDKVGFGRPIDPDASPYPLSIANPSKTTPPTGTPIDPEKRTPSPRRRKLADLRGERTDLPDPDDTIGGGG
jgi:hypothetical protein